MIRPAPSQAFRRGEQRQVSDHGAGRRVFDDHALSQGVEAGKTDDGTKVIAKMKELPTDDPLFGKGTVRADGRKLHPAYLVEVKKPSESKGPYDYYKIRATIPADQAFRPMSEGGCPLVK